MECNKCKRIVEKYCQIAGKDIYECFDDSECHKICWNKIEKEKAERDEKDIERALKYIPIFKKSDLIKCKIQYRDTCKRFYHPSNTNLIFKYSRSGELLEINKENFNKED